MKKRLIIAIDGYSGCGKSTIAKDLAIALNYTFIDSGAMYRGITLFAIQNNLIKDGSIQNEQLIKVLGSIQIGFSELPVSKNHLLLNGIDVEEEIRTPEVAALVSKIATIKEVRQKLVVIQREIGRNGGIVMDGRDIGSVVFPNADVKLFITADNTIRAKRRLKEMKAKGIQTTLKAVLQNLEERDELDRTRKESPLVQTEDAILIDTTDFTREGQLKYILEIIQGKLKV
ncbi:MAG: (d)CMP kinase [Crocinitomicaceae bacterium]|nr:(d)CMP kinase [Crocinitomicaceae bacterium]